MTWITTRNDEVTAQDLYRLSKKHRLIPANAKEAIKMYQELAKSAIVFDITDTQKRRIATVIISNIIDGESADVDLIPTPKYFAGDEFRDQISDALSPSLRDLIKKHDLRRLNAAVPESRYRTKKALRACGFELEGKMLKAAHFMGEDPEDLFIMGLYAQETEMVS